MTTAIAPDSIVGAAFILDTADGGPIEPERLRAAIASNAPELAGLGDGVLCQHRETGYVAYVFVRSMTNAAVDAFTRRAPEIDGSTMRRIYCDVHTTDRPLVNDAHLKQFTDSLMERLQLERVE